MGNMDRELQRAILLLAPEFEARDDAPATFAELLSIEGRARLPAWRGASDRCIYGAPEINFAFRAWHDAVHLAGRFDFSPAGERRTCQEQIRQFYYKFPAAPAAVAALLDVEINGQVEYFVRRGQFPVDQARFVAERLTRVQLHTLGLPEIVRLRGRDQRAHAA